MASDRISSRDLHPSQRDALRRLVRFFQERNRDGVTSVRFDLGRWSNGDPRVEITTRRSDCGPSSLRAILSRELAIASIGKRGRVRVYVATKHVETSDEFRSWIESAVRPKRPRSAA